MSEYKVICGDCREIMRGMPEASIDAIVTDPPYGLGFMGKDWDHGVPGEHFWREAVRVAKPGAHLLAFGGTRMYHRLMCAIEDAGWEIRDCIMWVYGSGFPKSHNLEGQWKGWGTALKPAWEPIIVARKSLDGTVAANMAEHGTGAMNVDGCRIDTNGEHLATPQSDPAKRRGVVGSDMGISKADRERFQQQQQSIDRTNHLGRWPANLIHDGSEEVLAAFPAAPGQQGALNGDEPSRPAKNTYGEYKGRREFAPRGDAGSAARFFYCAKASQSDRNDGADNTHPTVKPTDLMRYLCRLVTPPGGTIFDPFTGSGSTGRGAVMEGFNFVGAEMDAEYVEIATKRIAAVQAESLFT